MRKPQVTIKVSPQQMDKLREAAKALVNEKTSKISKAIGRAVLAIDRDAKKNTPVDTGRLRSSYDFSWRAGDLSAVIWNPVEYAAEVEYGTKTRKGVFMLTNAYKANVTKMKSEIERILKG